MFLNSCKIFRTISEGPDIDLGHQSSQHPRVAGGVRRNVIPFIHRGQLRGLGGLLLIIDDWFLYVPNARPTYRATFFFSLRFIPDQKVRGLTLLYIGRPSLHWPTEFLHNFSLICSLLQ
jgi:hypothetical protein